FSDYPEQLVELIRREYEGAVLFPFPWCEDELEFELAKIFTRLKIVSREKERKRLTDDLVKMTEVFRALKKCKKPRVVLIEGPPGMGKTTYCQKLAYDWSVGEITTEPSFPEVDMFLRLTCRDMKTANIEDAIDDQLLPIDVDKKDKEKFFHFIRHNQTRILLVLDGLDELPKKLFEEFMPLISGRVFPLTYVMLTARHEAGMKVRRHCDALFEIVGYTKEDADDYITKYFSSHEKPILAKKLIMEIDRDSQLRELTASALNTALLCLVFEDTGGVLPYNRTMLYFELVSCVLRRYCSRRQISLDDKDPVKKYTEQLNQLGELALEALLKDQLSFTFEELKSHSTEFLELGFLSRQPSASRIKPKPSYAFIHKTFQEYFASFHLAHELLTTERDKAALLAQLTPVDKYWQIWKFLITMAASKSDDTAAFLVSSICAAFPHRKPGQFFYRPYVQQAKDRDDKPVLFTLPYKYDDVCRDAKYYWEPLNRGMPFPVGRESFVVKTIAAIAQCEHPNTGIKPYQIKMAGALARCFPMDEITVNGHYFTLNSQFFVMFEFLNGNCKLNKLTWELNVSAAAALVSVLKACHTLKHLRLTNGSYITSITPALQANHTVTHLDMREAGVGDVEAEALGRVLQSNHTLTHLCLADNKISHIGVEALAEALKFNRVLEDLNIARNNIGNEGAVALSQALVSNRKLRCLNFCTEYLYGPFVDERLKDIHEQRVSDLSLAELGKAIQSNYSLTHLYVGCAQFLPNFLSMVYSKVIMPFFGDSSAKAFSKALQSGDTQLARLALNHISISSPCVIILAEGLRVNGTLERLDLSQNRIDCSGAVALAQALKTNQTLTHLQLRENFISDDGAKEFVEVLQRNKTLMFLGLIQNPMTKSGRDLFEVLGGRLEPDECRSVVFTPGVKWIRNS
ncbi:NLR family CARD domain-containing protein 3-like, partial [Stylophora pistillata]|uniref:NLR family CARD domain-containing protein 3-like n=1 Tax=Stylophora pistillata TaxID=50429 RepID=UPI000C056830